jgi:cytochrome c-type biogenesis protein CcmH
MIWLVLGAVTVVVLLVLARPLMRSSEPAPPRSAYDLRVYRAQLQELESDADRGLLPGNDVESARHEIARRMLAADQVDATAARTEAGPHSGRRALVLLVVLVPALAAGLYGWRGNPMLPGQPASVARVNAPPDVPAPELRDAVARLEARLQNQPDDGEGWLLLGRSYMIMRTPDRAVEAFRRAIAANADDPRLPAYLGESLVMAADGVVTPAARESFERAIAADPGDPAARFYLALGDSQAGKVREAFERWSELAAETPADAPWRAMLVTHLEGAARQLGIDPRRIAAAPAPPSVGPRGPTEEDVRNAQSMSAADRTAMIRGMVEGLAERLRQNPDDVEGWQRLVRSYQVLGDTERAREAQARLDRLRSAGGSPPPPRGPSAADIAAAGRATPEERNDMIASMVAGLAQRLANEPNDREGWLRLARSYVVLGRTADSLAAYERAAELWPRDAEILHLHARAALENSATADPIPFRVVNLYRRLLEVDGGHGEALFYVGLGESQRGNNDEAERLWRRLLGQVDGNSEIARMVRSRLDQLGTKK